MRPIFVVRAAAVAALLAVSFISFPSFPGARSFTVNSPEVDRTFKGDRLPLTAPAGSPNDRRAGFVAPAVARKGLTRLRRRLQPDRHAVSGQHLSALHGLNKFRTV
jgi:hypothetical protein